MKSIRPYSMRCVEAIAVMVGGRRQLAKKLGLSKPTIAHWFVRNEINAKYALSLVTLSEGKFSLEEILGKYDEVDGGN